MKLHLGCGDRYIEGFVHIDINDSPHIDHQSDLMSLPFLSDNIASVIYSSHTLEYFDRDEVGHVLREWRRILCPGGVLRIAVPDFAAIVEIYHRFSDIEHRGILGPLYGKWPIGLGGQHVYHKTAYDYKSLETTLTASGFKEIKRFDWRKTSHACVDDYSQAYIPHLAKTDGVLISLNVEAKK